MGTTAIPTTADAPGDGAVAVRPSEAARRLGVSRSTIFELLACGDLRSVKLGRCRLIPVSELHRLAQDRR